MFIPNQDENIEKELADMIELVENGVIVVDRYCERIKSMFLSGSSKN